MRKTFVLAFATTALCSLAISAGPAFGHEFDGETSSPTTTKTAQIIQLGSNWVECDELETTASPASGLSSRLKIKWEKFTGCSYNYGLAGHPVIEIHKKCSVELTSTNLAEVFTNEFDEGRAKPECIFQIVTAKCKIVISEPTAFLPEFEWRNTDLTSGHFESLLIFRLEKLSYTITEAEGAGCGSSGTNGEYDGSMPIKGVIVK